MGKWSFFIGIRKWLMAIIFVIVAVVFRVLDYIPAEGWLEAVAGVMTAFMATNIGEHITNAIKEWYEIKKR